MTQSKLYQLLICPQSGGKLYYMHDQQELWCLTSGLAYPIRDDIPIMLPEQARTLTLEEKEQLRQKNKHNSTE